MTISCNVCKAREPVGYERHDSGEPLRALCDSCVHLVSPSGVFEDFGRVRDERKEKLVVAMSVAGKLDDDGETLSALLEDWREK